MNWRLQARQTINEVVDKNVEIKNMKKEIDKAYPFGERKLYPYKAWMKERAIAFKRLGILEQNKNIPIGGLFE